MPKRPRSDDGNGETHTRRNDEAIWSRVMKRRRKKLDELTPQQVVSILSKIPRAPNSSIPANGMSPREQIIAMSWEHVEIAGDSTLLTAQRRRSHDALNEISSLINSELNGTTMQDSQSTVATARRSVFDRVDLSATNSTVPGGTASSTNLNVGVGSNLANHQPSATSALDVAGNVPVHPPMQRSSASATIPAAGAPIHPAFLGRLSSTSSDPTAEGTPSAASLIHPALQNSVTSTAGSSTATAIATRRPSVTDGTTVAAISNSTTTGGSAPIHPAMMQGGNVSAAPAPSSTTTRNHTSTAAPVHPSMQQNSSSTSRIANATGALDAAVRRTSTTSANSTVLVHPSMQRNSSSAGTTTETVQAPLATNTTTGFIVNTSTAASNLPVHPSMNSSSAGTVTTTATGAATGATTNAATVNVNGNLPVHPSMQTKSPGNNTRPTGGTPGASNTGGGNLPVHPSMRSNSSSAGTITNARGIPSATTTANGSAAGSRPVHPSMQGNSSLAGATTTASPSANGSAAGSRPVHPPMHGNSSPTSATATTGKPSSATIASGSAAASRPLHPSMQKNSSSAGTTTTTNTNAARNAALPLRPSMQKMNSRSTSGTVQNGTTVNGQGSSSSSHTRKVLQAAVTATNRNGGASTAVETANRHPRSSSSNDQSSAATTRTSTVTTTNPSVSRQTSSSNSIRSEAQRTSSTPETTTLQSGSSSSGQNPPQQNGGRPVGQSSANQAVTGTATSGNASGTNQPATASSQSTASTTSATTANTAKSSGTTVTKRTIAEIASGQSSAATTRTSTATTTNPSVSRQTSSSNSIRTEAQRTSSTPETTTLQGGSSSSGQNPPQQNGGRPAGQSSANQGVTRTASGGNASGTNQPSTASSQSTASTTSATTANTAKSSGTTVTKPTNGAVASSTSPIAGRNGTIRSDADNKAKENKKPAAANPPQGPKEIMYFEPRRFSFPADPGDGVLTGCAISRPSCTVTAKIVSRIPYRDLWTFGSRLACNEPYWVGAGGTVASGMTSKVEKVEWPNGFRGSVNEPKTVWTRLLSASSLKKAVGLVEKWGESSKELKEGEYRLLLRMIPFKVNEKMKKKRADCHLWPKGTMLLLDGKPLPLDQRKQQSHDKSEWKQMCTQFDLSSAIRFPAVEKHLTRVQLCCYDDEQYAVDISVCQYRSPQFLYRKLLGKEPECNTKPEKHKLERLSLEASMKKAKELINQQLVVLDDDIENTNKNDESVGKFVFSLVDPVNKKKIVTPVRGIDCKHFQCFDLETFLNSNLVVSGNRWRCPCCERFLKYHQLQFCGLTKAALDKFGAQVTASRGRVEFRQDETYELLPEDKLRGTGAGRRAGGSGTGNPLGVQTKQAPGEPRARPAQQTIEIIEIDSD